MYTGAPPQVNDPEFITVRYSIRNPKSRYEFLTLMSCGHWFAGWEQVEGAVFKKEECTQCNALSEIMKGRERLSHGNATLRKMLDTARRVAEHWRTVAEESGTHSEEPFPWEQ